MMKRALLTFVAATAISAPAMMMPAMFTPAAAQANLDVSIGIPGGVPLFGVAPQPVYTAWGAPGYRRWEDRRVWERNHWREERREEWREHHYYR